jgi:pyruvate dehydrogenase E2 component (dihydrolipoamide acetyltransferase)
MSDPTITVTNLGDRGVDMAFPVIIPPQVAMVGFGKVVEEVVALAGSPAVHPVVHATLAADHRVTDGHTGGLFLTELNRLLQHPETL